MKSAFVLSILALGLGFAGCQAVGVRARNAELKTGPRFDDEDKFTDQPSVTVPLWSSEGIKDRPVDLSPPRADAAR